MRTALVHYHEIGLKGRNRSAFERRLQSNLDWALRGLTAERVNRIASRLVVPVTDPARADEVLAAIALTPGVSNAGYGVAVARAAGAISDAAVEMTREETDRLGGAATFRIDARRSATQYAESSLEMNRRIGDVVREATGLAVNLSAPDVTCRVEVVQANAYVYARRVEGPGGLPVGVSGTVAALLSTGLDSPVAAWRVMKRGAMVVGVHFSGRPQTSGSSERYAREIAALLARGGGMKRLWIVPFGEVQREIALSTPADLRVLLYRRFMVRVAEAIACEERAKALVTGESLGQVASQTMENIGVVDAAATLPVFRPLIGSDKQEIIDQARQLGTYAPSIATDDDCCTLFMPRNPETHATLDEVITAEGSLDVAGLVAAARAGATAEDLPHAGRPRGERART